MPLGTQDLKQLFFKDIAAKTLRNPLDAADNFDEAADLQNFINNADNTAGHADENLYKIVNNMIVTKNFAMSTNLASAIAAHPSADLQLFDSLINFARTYLAPAEINNVVMNILNNADGKTRAEQAAIDTSILQNAALSGILSVAALEKIAQRTAISNELDQIVLQLAAGKLPVEQAAIETAVLSRDVALIAQMSQPALIAMAQHTEISNELDKLVLVAVGKPLADQAALYTAILADRASGNSAIIDGMSTASMLEIAKRTKDRINLERIIAAAPGKPLKERAEIFTSILEQTDDTIKSLPADSLATIAAHTETNADLEKIASLLPARSNADQVLISTAILQDRVPAKPELINSLSGSNLVNLIKGSTNPAQIDKIIAATQNKPVQEQKCIDSVIYNIEPAIFNAISQASLEILAARAIDSVAIDKIAVALNHNGNPVVQQAVCNIIFDLVTKNQTIVKDMDQKNIIALIGYASKEHLAYIVSRNKADGSTYDTDVDRAIINNPQTAAAELVQLAKRSQSGDDLNAIALHANTNSNQEVYKALISNKLTQTATLQHLLTNGHIEHIDNDALLDIVLHNNAVADDGMLDQIMLLDRVKDDSRVNKDKIQLFKLHRHKLDLESKEKPDPKTNPVLFSAYHQAQRTIIGVDVLGERAVITSKEQAELIHKHGKTASVAQNIADPDSAEHLMKVGREAHASVLKAKLGVNW